MSDIHETVQISAASICLCVFLCFCVFCFSQCEVKSGAVEEATKQEAIKAGYTQGEYNRWVAPGVKP